VLCEGYALALVSCICCVAPLLSTIPDWPPLAQALVSAMVSADLALLCLVRGGRGRIGVKARGEEFIVKGRGREIGVEVGALAHNRSGITPSGYVIQGFGMCPSAVPDKALSPTSRLGRCLAAASDAHPPGPASWQQRMGRPAPLVLSHATTRLCPRWLQVRWVSVFRGWVPRHGFTSRRGCWRLSACMRVLEREVLRRKP